VDLIFRGAETSVEDADSDEAPPSPAPKRRGRRSSSTKASSTNGEVQARAKGSGRVGGLGMLNQLLASGFFKKARTIGEIVSHCETNLAVKYKQSDFSGPLIRLVRDQKLKRVKNKDQQYEYSQQ
jgi:hypothetical protein